MFGGGNSAQESPANKADATAAEQPQQYSQKCEFEWRQFMDWYIHVNF